jgi:hypothetical protein
VKRIAPLATCAVLACLTALTGCKTDAVPESAAGSPSAAVSESATASASAAVSKAAAVPGSAAVTTSATFKAQGITGPPPPKSGIDHNVVALGTVKLPMAANQTAYVVSSLRANKATVVTLVDNEVRCTWPGGSKNLVMGQNIYAGTGKNPQWEDNWIVTKFLLHPGVAATATCTTYARVASLYKQKSSVRIVGGSLRFADKSVANAANGKPLDSEIPYGDLPVDSTKAHRTVRQPALPKTTAPAGLHELNVFGDVDYLVCHGLPCNKKGASTAKFTLIVNQWDKDGKNSCHSDASTSVTKTIPYAVHHGVVPLYLPHFKVSTAAGCGPVFSAYVRVDWQSGETGAVQGTAVGLPDMRGSTTAHRSAMSHLYIVPA